MDLLAQSGKIQATQGEVVLWVAVLIVVAFLGGMVIVWVRKKMFAKDSPADAGTLIDQLRGMVARGEMTQSEFEATKRAMVRRLKARGLGASPGASQPPAEHPTFRRDPARPTRPSGDSPSA